MATTSFGSSTTQMAVRSRRGSAQIRHCSDSATLPQVSQNRTLALTSVSTSTRRLTSMASACSRWNAMRWALLGPTPGSRPSSSIRSWTTPSYTPVSLCPRGVAGGPDPLAKPRREPHDGELVDQATHVVRDEPVPDRGQPQPQLHPRCAALDGGQPEAPRQVGAPPRRAVEKVPGRRELEHRERRVRPTPVRDHVADRELLVAAA